MKNIDILTHGNTRKLKHTRRRTAQQKINRILKVQSFMPTRTVIHPRQGAHSSIGSRLKNRIFSGRISGDEIINTFPKYLDSSMDIELHPREHILGASYNASQAYWIKIITGRHVRIHQFLTWWRNKIFSISNLHKPFTSFENPEQMACHEYEAASCIANKGGSIPVPIKQTTTPNNSHGAILYEYVPNNGKLTDETKTLKAYDHIIQTVRQLHNGGHIHTSIPDHILQSIPNGEPYITDPFGRVKNTDKSQLLGIGFDLASLLARYTTSLGALPCLKTTSDYYSDVELIAAYNATKTLRFTVPKTSTWVSHQLRSSINEYSDPEAVETYKSILNTDESNIQEKTPHSSPYQTKEFIEKVSSHSQPSKDTRWGNESIDDVRLGAEK